MSEGEQPLKVRHVTKDFKTGEIVSKEESFGPQPTTIVHKTRIGGEAVSITRKPGQETQTKTQNEDPLNLRNKRQ